MDEQKECRCPLKEWEIIPWIFVLVAVVVVLANVLSAHYGG